MRARLAALAVAAITIVALLASAPDAAEAKGKPVRTAAPSRSAAPTASLAPSPAASPTPSATPTPAPRLEGIDVSQWQGTINWGRVAGAGKAFAMVRASAGTLTRDTTYATNRSAAKAAGLKVSAYHYANPDRANDDALNEANWFLENATPATGEMIPALDVEVTNGLSVAEMQAWVATWLQRVTTVTGVRPMVYTSPSFWATSMGDTRQFADAGYTVLWIAHWTSAAQPTVPAQNWGGRGWTFWQYSSTGSVAGVSGNVDLDRFNGTSLPASLFIP